MQYKYIFADGTTIELDIKDEQVYKLMRRLDRQTRYNNAKNFAVELSEQHADNTDILGEIEKSEQDEKELIRLDLEKFGRNYSKAQLLKVLTEKQALVYFYYRYAKMKIIHIAKRMNVTEGMIRKFIKKAELNLQKHNIKDIEPDNAIKLITAIFYSNL